MDSRDSKSASVTIRCKGAEAVRRLADATQAFVAEHALPAGDAARLSIIVEELACNLSDHGEIGADGFVELVLVHEPGAIAIMLSDSGVAFDLRSAESGEAIPERGGGAGIALVRAWAEIVDYASEPGRNRLRLRMPLS